MKRRAEKCVIAFDLKGLLNYQQFSLDVQEMARYQTVKQSHCTSEKLIRKQ